MKSLVSLTHIPSFLRKRSSTSTSEHLAILIVRRQQNPKNQSLGRKEKDL